MCLGVFAALLLAGNSTRAEVGPKPSSWEVSVSVAAKLAYDNNVFLQDHGDQAGHRSWVSQLGAGLTAVRRQGEAFKATLAYAPEVVVYASAGTEDHVSHRGSLSLVGNEGGLSWKSNNSVLWINGSALGPRFTGGGDIPAIGGVPLRDRRDGAVYRHHTTFTWTSGRLFLRPAASFYGHDFRTEHHVPSEPGFSGYENYIDRREVYGGIDAGWSAGKDLWLVLGSRMGEQKQKPNAARLPSPYSNRYLRVLAGLEGKPAPWLRLDLLAGPDFRSFPHATPAGFHRDEVLFQVDATATVTPTPEHTLTLSTRRFLQPAFSSHSLYQDILYDLAYQRRIDSQWMVAAGLKLSIADWQAPVQREDWVYTSSLRLQYSPHPRASAGIAWCRDQAESKVPGTQGREFTRTIVSLDLSHRF